MRPMIFAPLRNFASNGRWVMPLDWFRTSGSPGQAGAHDPVLDVLGHRVEVDHLRRGDEHVVAGLVNGKAKARIWMPTDLPIARAHWSICFFASLRYQGYW
jgi:hypothetical protein